MKFSTVLTSPLLLVLLLLLMAGTLTAAQSATEEDAVDAEDLCNGDLKECVRHFLTNQALMKLEQQQQQQEPSDSCVGNCTELARLVRGGFDRLQQKSTTQVISAIQLSAAKRFREVFTRFAGLPRSVSKSFKSEIFDKIEEQPEGKWRTVSAVYSSPNWLHNLLLFTRRNSNSFDFAYAKISLSIRLADDILVLQRVSDSTSQFYQEDELLLKRVPPTISEKDINDTVELLRRASANLLLKRL